MENFKSKIIKVASLFFSFSTLLCCALPAILGLLGFGAAMVGLISIFPFLITLSMYKNWLFFSGFILLAVNGYYVFFKIKSVCPIELSVEHQMHSTGCDIATDWNKIGFWVSAAMLVFGFFMAYLALPLFKTLKIL